MLAHSVLPPRFDSSRTLCQNVIKVSACSSRCRLRLKRDGTRAETRFLLSAKRTSPFKSAGASVQWIIGSRGVRISGSNVGYTTFRGSVKGTGYPLHSPVSPSLPLPCVTVCHHISNGIYDQTAIQTYLRFQTERAIRESGNFSFIDRNNGNLAARKELKNKEDI